MSKKINKTFIGAFVLGAVILWIVTVLLLAGGRLFRERRQHMMYFHGAAQGLKVGAPVVFLGVKIGTVKRIQLGLDEENHTFLVPVTIEVDAQSVLSTTGNQVDLQSPQTIQKLVEQGLRAQLKMQSLLTGQLYVDLNFYDNRKANFISKAPGVSEIPTIPTRVEELTTILEDFPVTQFLSDLSNISDSISKITSSTESKDIPAKLEKILDNLDSLTKKIDASTTPLLTDINTDLVELRKSLKVFRTTMSQAGKTIEQVREFVSTNSRISQTITHTSQQVEEAATAIQYLTNDESPTIQRLNMALLEISRSARSMRLLAETIEQQPEAILKGKRANNK